MNVFMDGIPARRVGYIRLKVTPTDVGVGREIHRDKGSKSKPTLDNSLRYDRGQGQGVI